MQPITIATKAGDVRCEQFGDPSGAAIVWAFGAGGGFGGPAGGLYTRLAERLIPHAIASLCVDYRLPGRLNPCVDDLLAGIDYLLREGARTVVLAGHSFGGAVVIQAGLIHPAVAGVAALSSQSYGTEGVENLSPRPLLLIHGMQDEILPPFCSEDIYARARQPKHLILYPGCMHGLDECAEDLDRDLTRWLLTVCLPADDT
jgi:fermentation-respiration switch protein FrsA (DUF1100 family)